MTITERQKHLQDINGSPYADVLRKAKDILVRIIDGPDNQVFNLSPVFRITRKTGYAVPDQQVGRVFLQDTSSERVVSGIADIIQRVPFNNGLAIYQLWAQRKGPHLFIEVVKVVEGIEDAFALARESNTGVVYSFSLGTGIPSTAPWARDEEPDDEEPDDEEPDDEEPDDEDVLVPLSVVRKEVEDYRQAAADLSEHPDLPLSQDSFKSMIAAYNLILKRLEQIERDYGTEGCDS